MTSARIPSVDVIITGHNYANWIEEAIDSIYKQTRRDYTLTVVDDASTDGMGRVAEKCLHRAPDGINRKLLRTADVGPSMARHIALRGLTSKYFLFIDADDLIAPTTLDRHVPALNRHPKAGFSYSDRQLFGEITHLYKEPSFDLKTLAYHNFVGGGVLVRREAYDQVGGFKRNNWGYAEDWDLWLDIGEAGWTGCHIREPLFLYRHHISTSLSYYVTRFLSAYMALLHVHHPKLYTSEQLRQDRAILRRMPKGWNRRAPYRTVEDCRQALVDSPGNTHLLFLLSMAHIKRQEFEMATSHLVKLLRIDPKDDQAKFALCTLRSIRTSETVCLYQERLSIQEAVCRVIQIYGHGIRPASIPPKVVRALAMIRPRSYFIDTLIIRCWEAHIARMRHDVAIRMLNDPSVFDGLADGVHLAELYFIHNIASRYKSTGSHDEARILFGRLLDTMLKIDKRNPEFHYQIGACYFHLAEMDYNANKFSESRRLFLNCIQYTPGHRMAAEYLNRIDKFLGSPKRK
jgi:GT2 family glycosyltransferase